MIYDLTNNIFSKNFKLNRDLKMQRFKLQMHSIHVNDIYISVKE